MIMQETICLICCLSELNCPRLPQHMRLSGLREQHPWLEIFLTLFRLAPESCSSPGPLQFKVGHFAVAASRAALALLWSTHCCKHPANSQTTGVIDRSNGNETSNRLERKKRT